jgi:hypothetical protein
MSDLINSAIAERRVLRIFYDPGVRFVEPHAHGLSQDGNGLLRAFQVSGASASGEQTHWKLFRTDKIEAIKATDSTFDEPRPGYRRGDSAMATIYAQL